jgi:hypothetical protein
MARSKFGENQIKDEIVLTEVEHDVRDHSTVSSGIPQTTLELSDTPASYDDGKFLRSTATGTEWATVSGAAVEYTEIYGGNASTY